VKAVWLATLAACGTNLTPSGDDRPPVVLDCLPNLDRRIDVAELPLPSAAKGSYWVSSNVAVDLAGAVAGTDRRWDWSQLASGDQLVEVEATGLAGAWFAATFPRGELVAPLDLEHTAVGVLARDAEVLTLLGIASSDPDPPAGRTLVVYDTPIPLYEFPIVADAHWAATGVISHGNGTIDGLPFIGEHRYDVAVAAIGELDLPELTIQQAFRIDTQITIAPSSGPSVARRSASFVFECLGEVARATSRDGEASPEFRVAAEVRRLGFQ